MEEQGSPIEQCALLIYLLRKAGYPAAYVFPEHNETLMFDQQLSKILKMQMRGAMNYLESAELPELIPVNYPWVAVYIDGKWQHIFPWLKDTKVTEGKDLWSYFPEGFHTGSQWLMKYLLNDPSIRSLSTEDNPATLFPLYAEEHLKEKGITLQDVGIKFVNQPHYYSDWNDFPRPWKTPPVSNANLAQNLDIEQNPHLSEQLTNIFDTINIQVISDRNNDHTYDPEAPKLETGPMKMVDLHNRRLLLYHKIIPGTDPAKYEMILSLEPYDSTNLSDDLPSYTFYLGDHPDPKEDLFRSSQKISTILENNDDALCYRVSYLHHQQAKEAPFANEYWGQFPGLTETLELGKTKPLEKGDNIHNSNALRKGNMACLSLCYGRVTKRMQDFEANKYRAYQLAILADSSKKVDPEIATGQLLQIMGQSYYFQATQFQQLLEEMTKTHSISSVAYGLAELNPARNPDGTLAITSTDTGKDLTLCYPVVDMKFNKTTFISNMTSHLDSGNACIDGYDAMALSIGEISADEHRVINQMFHQNGAISTVKLLDIAQGWTPDTGKAASPGSGVFIINDKNKDSVLATNNHYTVTKDVGNGMTFNFNIDANFAYWLKEGGLLKSVENAFNSFSAEFATIIATPTPQNAVVKNGMPYTGMGAMILSDGNYSALISGDMHTTLHGGYGEKIPSYYNIGQQNPSSSWANNISLTQNANGTFSLNNWMEQVQHNNIQRQLQQFSPNSGSSSMNFNSNINNSLISGTTVLSPDSLATLNAWNKISSSGLPGVLPGTGADTATAQKEIANKGFIGLPVYYGKSLTNFVMDPVSVVTGEFYLNALDLQLNGPMPLAIRRIYGSQNQTDDHFGHGWRLSYFPYLMLSSDSETTPSLIDAAETDGSIIAYRYQPDQKVWIPTTADNPTLINPAEGTPGKNNNLFNNRITQNTVEGVVTYTLTGSDGSVRTFKTRSFPRIEEPTITRTRPYLDTWRDNQGNCYTFSFGENNKATDWGQLRVITSSNGNSFHFRYDTFGHITEAFSSDGRTLKYEYDTYGDLTKVTLPDASIITYSYDHQQASAEGGASTTYSTHLITQETNPNGRILQNIYDSERRVVTQSSTVGTSVTPVKTASFNYNAPIVSDDHTLSGTTTITDVTGNSTTYNYAGSQIIKISYPPSSTGVTSTITQEWYQPGEFASGAYPRSLKNYVDRRGLLSTYQYDNRGNLTSHSLTGNITGSGAIETATTSLSYNNNNLLTSLCNPVGNSITYSYGDSAHLYNPTSITKTASGKIISTAQLSYQNVGGACGLLASMNCDGAITEYTYDKHGFLASQTQQTGTKDPNITRKYTTNSRGEIISETDDRGCVKKYNYDDCGRKIFDQTLDKTGALIDWHALYYNFNGDLEWEQGARFNPVDYAYYDYDRAGHVIHKATWLSAALIDGTGVAGSGLATTSYNYDNQGSCTSIIDPNGNKTTMEYDALGEMTSRTLANGAKESFTYDSDGKIATHTTVLGATESFSYTSTGLLQSASLADGTRTYYHYDLAGRLIQEQPSRGPTCNITYNGNTITRTFSATDKNLGSTSETYDGRSNLLEKTDLTGNTWNFSYDGLNRIKTEEGPTQKTIHYYKLGCESWVNNQGAWENNFFDAVGRKILTTLFNPDGTIAYNESNFYNPDHQSVTTTIGTGANAIVNTLYTDTRGLPVLLKHLDESYRVIRYDANGNKSFFIDEEGKGTVYSYDALNHLTTQRGYPDGPLIKYSFDPAGNLLTRSMPEGLVEQNSYNQAGQKTSSCLTDADGLKTRNYIYNYQNGLLSSIVDPRSFTTEIDYDVWMRPTSVISSGSRIPEQNQKTLYTYNPRGLITAVEQHYNDSSTGPSTLVSRAYDACGQLTSETTSLNGTPLSSWTQTWDSAGRRTTLNWNLSQQNPGAEYAFSYNALGEMTSSQNSSGTCSYVYGDNGLLSQKSTPSGTTTFTRDKNGNIITATLPDSSTESLTYRADGKVSSYAISGDAGNETRNYKYDLRGRVTKEPYLLEQSTNNLSAGTQRASYAFDDLNIRLKQEVTADVANIVSEKDNFAQVTLDSLSPDASTPTAWTSGYDGQGNLTTHNSDTSNQLLTWDSFGHLVNVNQSSSTTTLNWSTVYDGLGRRIQTTSQGNTINYYYDPEVEFLELGHSVNGNRQWNLYGPDRSGVYGGAQGIGGLETCFTENTKSSFGIINNYFGDVVGLVSAGTFTPYRSALGGYGPMPGSSINNALQPQWRGHYLDDTGLYYMGTRYYDPQTGRFISPDPLGHGSSLGLYDYCAGDPVNGLDPDGRCVEGTAKGYTLGTFAEYDNTTQAIGGFVGTLASYATPGLGEAAFVRDVAGSAWHGLQAIGDMHSNGLNWRNGTTLGLSTLGVGVGAFAALVPAKVAVEAATSIEESAVSSFPAGYQGGPGAMWSGEVLENNLSLTQGSRMTENSNLLPSTAGRLNDVVVIGRQTDTAVAANWEGHKVLSINNWTPELNDSFIDTAIKNRQSFYIASPINYNTLWNPVRNSMTIFGRELGQIYKAGYKKIGDYLHPPQ